MRQLVLLLISRRGFAQTEDLTSDLANATVDKAASEPKRREASKKSFNLIRHKGDSDEICKMKETPTLIGEQCVASCT